MINRVCSYLWLTDEDFRDKYYGIYEDFIDKAENYYSANIDDIGYVLTNHWITEPDLIEDYPDFIDDICEQHDLTSDQILEVINNGGANINRTTGVEQMGG